MADKQETSGIPAAAKQFIQDYKKANEVHAAVDRAAMLNIAEGVHEVAVQLGHKFQELTSAVVSAQLKEDVAKAEAVHGIASAVGNGISVGTEDLKNKGIKFCDDHANTPVIGVLSAPVCGLLKNDGGRGK